VRLFTRSGITLLLAVDREGHLVRSEKALKGCPTPSAELGVRGP
jgi:hypothetical protein